MIGKRFMGQLAFSAMACVAIAQADEVTVRGSSTGYVMGQSGVSFQGTDFAATTTASNSLGVLSLQSGSVPARPGTLIVRLTLAAAAGGESATRALRASVMPNTEGGVSVHFTTENVKARFESGNIRGSFNIQPQDLSLRPGESLPVLAVVTGSQEIDTACRLNFMAARAVPAILPAIDQTMTPVVIKPAASDLNGCALTCKIESVTMNEPTGPSGDYEITGDLSLKVRADRLNSGHGRIYNVAVRCTDNAGNSVTQNAPVVVPR